MIISLLSFFMLVIYSILRFSSTHPIGDNIPIFVYACFIVFIISTVLWINFTLLKKQ